jgi:UDP-glucose 4-epimerase
MGFIGLHTAQEFLGAGEDVVITRHRTIREPSFLKEHSDKKLRVERADVADLAGLIDLVRRYRVDSIVHLAVPPISNRSFAEDCRVNLSGLLNVLEVARSFEARRVSLASSLAVYFGIGDQPCIEDAPLPTASPVATSAFKKVCDILGTHFADRSDIDVMSLRIGQIYGPLYHSLMNVPSRLVHAAVKGRPFDATGGGAPVFAEDTSDLCYVKDCAHAIRLVHLADNADHAIYNIGSGVRSSNADVADAVAKAVAGTTFDLPSRTAAARPKAMDISRLSAEFGFAPRFSLEAGIAEYAEWLAQNDL